MRALILAGVLAAMAAPALAQQMPAPSPEGAIRVAADQSGQTVEAAAGSVIAIELQASGSTGTSWSVASKPVFIADPEVLSGPTVTPQAGRPMMGAPRWQVFVFPVSEAGAGEIVLVKRGPSRTAAPLETFTITVSAN
jgi:hypothetical protein